MLLRIVSALVFVASGIASAQCTPAGKRILHIGDSLTLGAKTEILAEDQARGALSSTVIAVAGAFTLVSPFSSLLAAEGKSINDFDGVVIALGTNDAAGVYLKVAEPPVAPPCWICLPLGVVRSDITSMVSWAGLAGARKIQWIVPHFPNKLIPSLPPNPTDTDRLVVANARIEATKHLGAMLEMRAALQEGSQQYQNLYPADFAGYLPFMTGQLLSNHLTADGTHMNAFAKHWFAVFHSVLGGYTSSSCTAAKQSISAASDAANSVVLNH